MSDDQSWMERVRQQGWRGLRVIEAIDQARNAAQRQGGRAVSEEEMTEGLKRAGILKENRKG